ncbi:Afadin- and alpha-actinin-binding protein [Entophlyctis sp. JEL0112]|nr:Afadin- and alpha-actinin-binding protein [Entophlyctis sp. JEL0112]
MDHEPTTSERCMMVNHLLKASGHELQISLLQSCSDDILNILFKLLANSQAKVRQSLEQSDRTNKALHVKIDSLESATKDLNEKLSAAKDEAAKASINLSASMAQFKHKSKRKEAEFAALQEKLQKLAVEQAHASKIGIRLINPNARKAVNLPARQTKAVKHEQEMYAVVISSHEEREKELLAELNSLKSTLFSTYAWVKDTEKRVSTNNQEENSESFASICEPQERARFNLPFGLVKNQIEAQFKESLQCIEANLDEFRNKVTESVRELSKDASDEEIGKLREEIEEYKMVVEKQKQLIEMSLHAQADADNHSMLVEEQEIMADLKAQQEALQRRSEQLNEERVKFTEAAIRLGRERVAFERERDLFEEEKRATAMAQILDQMPETPQWLKKKPEAAKLEMSPRSVGESANVNGESRQLPKTPTPQNHSTARRPARQIQRITTPSDAIRKTPQSSQSPASIVAHNHSEVLTESNTFANTPAVLRMMMDAPREIPSDFDSPVSFGSEQTPAKKIVKSAMKKGGTPPGETSSRPGSTGKRRVVIDVKENLND